MKNQTISDLEDANKPSTKTANTTKRKPQITPTKIDRGNPYTHVYYCESEVIKVHLEQKHSYRNGQTELKQHQLQESNLGFSHPDKKWFLTKADSDAGKYYIANRCPELKTLSEVMPKLKPLAQIQLISQLLRYQFQAIKAGLSLDLDLSNFAVTESHHLYYIDDDIYRWNDNNMISDFLASLIRSQEWLDKKVCRGIGKSVAQLVSEYAITSITTAGISQALMEAYLAMEKFPLRNDILIAMGGVKPAKMKSP
jgi:hypothetical protein